MISASSGCGSRRARAVSPSASRKTRWSTSPGPSWSLSACLLPLSVLAAEPAEESRTGDRFAATVPLLAAGDPQTAFGTSSAARAAAQPTRGSRTFQADAVPRRGATPRTAASRSSSQDDLGDRVLPVRSVDDRRFGCLITLSRLAVALSTDMATASASGTSVVPSYCSPSGDVCYGIFKRRGQIVFRITAAAHYFSRYTLCMTRLPRSTNPEHARRCGAFPVFRLSGSTWGSTVNFARNYCGPHGQRIKPDPGRYRVTWRNVCGRCTPQERRHSARGQPLGPSLYFRVS